MYANSLMGLFLALNVLAIAPNVCHRYCEIAGKEVSYHHDLDVLGKCDCFKQTRFIRSLMNKNASSDHNEIYYEPAEPRIKIRELQHSFAMKNPVQKRQANQGAAQGPERKIKSEFDTNTLNDINNGRAPLYLDVGLEDNGESQSMSRNAQNIVLDDLETTKKKLMECVDLHVFVLSGQHNDILPDSFRAHLNMDTKYKSNLATYLRDKCNHSDTILRNSFQSIKESQPNKSSKTENNTFLLDNKLPSSAIPAPLEGGNYPQEYFNGDVIFSQTANENHKNTDIKTNFEGAIHKNGDVTRSNIPIESSYVGVNIKPNYEGKNIKAQSYLKKYDDVDADVVHERNHLKNKTLAKTIEVTLTTVSGPTETPINLLETVFTGQEETTEHNFKSLRNTTTGISKNTLPSLKTNSSVNAQNNKVKTNSVSTMDFFKDKGIIAERPVISAEDIHIPRIISKEMDHEDAKTSVEGFEVLPNKDFSENKLNGTIKKKSNSFEITGKLYFLFEKEEVPAIFIQKPDGVHIGLNGTYLCQKLKNSADSVILSTLCKNTP